MTTIVLPLRSGPLPEIGLTPPQLQFSDLGTEQIRIFVKTWAFSSFPNVTEHDTIISVPATRAMWLDESVTVAHSDAFMPRPNSREFCHIHEDGSLHAVVDSELEDEIIRKQWGVRHMYYDRGVKEMLIYAPRDAEEIEVIKTIIRASYQYATGDNNFY